MSVPFIYFSFFHERATTGKAAEVRFRLRSGNCRATLIMNSKGKDRGYHRFPLLKACIVHRMNNESPGNQTGREPQLTPT